MTMQYDRNSFEDMEALYASVSRMPELVDTHEFDSAIRRISMERRSNSIPPVRVLMGIHISATGEIVDVVPVVPRLPDGITAIAVCVGSDGSRTISMPPVSEDPGVIAIAAGLCRRLKFRPAERDGTAVEFPDWRFGIEL